MVHCWKGLQEEPRHRERTEKTCAVVPTSRMPIPFVFRAFVSPVKPFPVNSVSFVHSMSKDLTEPLAALDMAEATWRKIEARWQA